jgi:hypothetical protein
MRQLKAAFAIGLPQASILGLPLILPRKLKSLPSFLNLIRRAGPAQIMFSNMGRLPIQRQYGPLRIEQMHLHASLSDTGDLLLSIGQFDDHFVLTLHYIEGGMPLSQAQNILQEFKNSLTVCRQQ